MHFLLLLLAMTATSLRAAAISSASGLFYEPHNITVTNIYTQPAGSFSSSHKLLAAQATTTNLSGLSEGGIMPVFFAQAAAGPCTEPATFILLGGGMLCFSAMLRRSRKS